MRLQAALAIAVSAAAWYFSTGFGEVWPLAWIAPIPVLWFALKAPSWREAAFVAGIAYLAGSLNLFSYIKSLMPLPIVAIVFFGAGVGLRDLRLVCTLGSRALAALDYSVRLPRSLDII